MTDSPIKTEPQKLPTDTESLFAVWQQEDTPANLSNVVRSLDSTIGYKLSSMGVGDNPQMKHQARIFAADAIRKYDPASGASLRTWTQNQLQSMNRFRRQSQGPVKIPDRASIDGWAIEKARRDLEDELGREPDVLALADRSGLSVKRIAAVKKITRPIAAAAQMYDDGAELPDFMGEALEYVYGESDSVDRKIIEMTTGYGGTSTLSKADIAAKLGISASQVTRRTERIGRKLQEMDTKIEEAHA